jgi:hypothetical protein
MKKYIYNNDEKKMKKMKIELKFGLMAT